MQTGAFCTWFAVYVRETFRVGYARGDGRRAELPTEPFKYLIMGAQAAGLTSTGRSDIENKVREFAAQHLGKTGGEILTKGLA